MPDAKFGERVDNGVLTAASPCVIPPSLPPRIPSGFKNLVDLCVESRQRVGAQHRVIQERARQQLAGTGLLNASLPHRLAEQGPREKSFTSQNRKRWLATCPKRDRGTA